ncbi:MAG: hypothetical protein ACM3JQ_01070 [Candidatus Eiseniibacteriota bacterium]
MLTEETDRAPKLFQLGIEENISTSDSPGAAKGVYFKLTEPVEIQGDKENGDDIDLHFDTADKDKLIAFVIWVSGPDLQDNTVAYQKAYRLTNLLTLKSGKFVFHKRPREFVNGTIGPVLKSIGQTSIMNTLVNLDISDNAIQSSLDNDSLVNQQLAHFANGIKAFDELNFIEAVKEFYQVIEDTPSHLKYKSLRNGLSHAELDDINTINDIQNNFGIVCKLNPSSTYTPKGKYIDISNPEVQTIIEKEANNLRIEAFRYIDQKVGIKTD